MAKLITKKTLQLTAYVVVDDTAKIEHLYLDKKQFAGLKRSGRWKTIISCRKIQEVTISITTKIIP